MSHRIDRFLAPFAIALALVPTLALSSCTGGTGPASSFSAGRCAATESKFCLVSCSLGCSNTGCSVSQIAQNQPITLSFSQPVDPSSVTSASVLLRTATGEPPIGDLLVDGANISFRPKIEILGGATFFGFRANETYILALPAGEGGQTLRAVSGEALGSQVVCQLTVSLGIVDIDNQPPMPTLLSPTTLTNVSLGTSVVIEFSELIDAAPFAGTGEGGPVEYYISRGARTGGVAHCDEGAARVTLPGTPQVTLDPVRGKTTVSFRPSVQLPGEACIEVRVTNRVRDLSGRPAIPISYQFVTEPSGGEDIVAIEEFDSTARLDTAYSSTRWLNGTALPGVVGGSGRHGEFDVSIGTDLGNGLYEWNLDAIGGFSIPGRLTLDGQEHRVTDGVFEFTRFELRAGLTLRIVGAMAPQFRVRGEALINGTIDISGAGQPLQLGFLTTGQAGSRGGPGGGRGGNGAPASNGTTAANGAHGQDVQVASTHGYYQTARDSGGRGALQFPADNASVTHAYSGVVCVQVVAGGGGGGYFRTGTAGVALRNPGPSPGDLAGPNAGGRAFQLFPLPSNAKSIEHFLAGGSGGGGGGSHIYSHTVGRTFQWKCGAGGTGGGGAIAVRTGGALILGDTGKILATGGQSYAPYNNVVQGPPGPNGGGSGGSVLLQSGSSVQAVGVINVSGGPGAHVLPGTGQALLDLEAKGGTGAAGFVRAEMPNNPGLGILRQVLPAVEPDMVGDLRDTDSTSGFTTKWYSTRLIFAPRYVRYEIDAEVNGVPVIFSDDPSLVGSRYAKLGAGEAISVLFQSGAVNPRDGTLTGEPGPWRNTVGAHQGEAGLSADGFTGYRFQILFNQGSGVVLRSVKIRFQS